MRIVNDKDNKHWMIMHKHQYDDDKDDNDFLPCKLYIALPTVQGILNYFIVWKEMII